MSTFDRFAIAAALGAGPMAISAGIARAQDVRRAEAALRERLDACPCGAAPHGRCRRCGVLPGKEPYDPPTPEQIEELRAELAEAAALPAAREPLPSVASRCPNRHERRRAASRRWLRR